MAEIVNLRAARKRKAREDAERTAETNRALFGRSKSEKQRDRAREGQGARLCRWPSPRRPGRQVSTVVKRSVTIRGHRTSLSLEQPFFDRLVAIAARRRMSLAALIAEVDDARPKDANLSSALRIHVLEDALKG